MPVIKYRDFDISTIDKDTSFILDTNVLYYVHSGYYLPDNQKCREYSNMIQNIISSGFQIRFSVLSLQELLFGIENKEYKNFCINNSKPDTYNKKQYRNDDEERLRVKTKLSNVMAELSIYTLDDASIKKDDIMEFVNSFNQHKMDPMDYIIVKNYNDSNIIYITEDKDFFSLSTINVLTA